MGRPVKIHPFIKATRKLLKEIEHDVFIFTDEELLRQINEMLEPKDRICRSTFQKWKEKALEKNGEKAMPVHFRDFLHLIKRALEQEKRELFMLLRTDKRAWQRWAWIIERKFSEWNLKQMSEVDLKGKVDTVTTIKIVKPK